MAELVLLLFALLGLESPSVSIGFVLAAIGVGVWRQYKIRKQLEELRQDWSEQNDALHRELIELRRQLAALPSLASDAERSAKPVDSPPPASVRTENIRVAVPSSSAERVDLRVPPTQIEHSALVAQSNIVETAQSKKPEDFASAPPVAESPAASPSSVYPSATPIPGKPPAPITTPSQPKIPPKSEPAISRTEPAPTYVTPMPSVPEPQPVSATEPSQAAGRTRLISVSGLEETLGTNWLNKLGIVIPVLGIALFGIYELGELGPSGRVALSCVVSAVLLDWIFPNASVALGATGASAESDCRRTVAEPEFRKTIHRAQIGQSAGKMTRPLNVG